MSSEVIDDIQIQEKPAVTGPVPVPNGELVLVLGICSIVFCFMYGITGIVAGIAGLYYHKRAQKLWEANRDLYTEKSIRNAGIGRVCSIVGICLGAFVLIAIITLIGFLIGNIK